MSIKDRLKTAGKLLHQNKALFVDSVVADYFRWLPDSCYTRLRFRCRAGYWPDLKHPKTFSEKINWLKLYYRKPEYTRMVDKLAAKEYVGGIIGNEYIISTLGQWTDPSDIEWDKLPDSFVLKTTNGGGSTGVIVCRDKNTLDKQDVVKKLASSLKKSIYSSWKEWPYKNVDCRVIAEVMLSDGKAKDLPDYKFYCFNGKPAYCQVIRDRSTSESIDFYDIDWNHQEFVGLNPNTHNSTVPAPRPEKLEDMVDICKALSKNIPFVRVDLYYVDGRIYFGELTFYPYSGFGSFRPSEWNLKLGNMLELPLSENIND